MVFNTREEMEEIGKSDGYSIRFSGYVEKTKRGESIAFSVVIWNKKVFLDSSMVEHTAVNRGVVGSSPTRGVKQRGCLERETVKNPKEEVRRGEKPKER